ncbi:aromatic ring-hydroxylating dioxygenase subunit alpha [Oricola sp.]|uniref:aromatic ring-hydroxylating dioxygenase subunit alpha n=1 Tax=Oricola sp. TaxID=1979950 RepID=UPI003BAAE923
MTSDVARNQWYPISDIEALPVGIAAERILMGDSLTVTRGAGDSVTVTSDRYGTLPVVIRFGHVWTSPGQPQRELFDIPEALHEGRRHVPCGCIRVRCSPLRAVENFLDIAHFPFVHTDILGVEEHPEVAKYDVRIDETNDEIWATKVRFFQPQAAASATGGIITEYMYRVPAPTVAILYKTCPAREGEWDIITLFVQPVGEDICHVWPWMALYDDGSSMTDMIQFQQVIFLQDRSILENQVPALLPLDPKMEIPTRADMTSIAYRRWLKRTGYYYGASTEAA